MIRHGASRQGGRQGGQWGNGAMGHTREICMGAWDLTECICMKHTEEGDMGGYTL